MKADLLILLGAMLGAFAARFLKPDVPTWNFRTAIEVLVTGVAVFVAGVVGIIPAEWLQNQAMANPLRMVLTTFVASTFAGAGAVELLKGAMAKWAPGPGK